MRNRGEWRAVMAMLPAIAGVSLSSGRELALFFGQLKQASWLGVFAASACFGGLLGLLLWRGPAVAAGSEALARLCAALRLLVAALTAAFMLSRLGAMGALTLPLRHGYAFGAAFGGCLALALWGIRKKWIAGAVLFAALVCSNFFLTSPLLYDIFLISH